MTVAPRFLQSNASSKQRVFKATCLQSNVSWLHGWHLQSNYNRVRAGGQARSASGSSTGEVPGRAKPIGKNVAAAPAPCSSQACAGHLSLISATLCPNPRKKTRQQPWIQRALWSGPRPLSRWQAMRTPASIPCRTRTRSINSGTDPSTSRAPPCIAGAPPRKPAPRGTDIIYIIDMHCECPWANPPGLP